MPSEQPMQSASTRRMNFFHSYHESLNQQGSFEYSSQHSFPPANMKHQLPPRYLSNSEQGLAHDYDARMRSAIEHSHSLETCNEHPWEQYSGKYFAYFISFVSDKCDR